MEGEKTKLFRKFNRDFNKLFKGRKSEYNNKGWARLSANKKAEVKDYLMMNKDKPFLSLFRGMKSVIDTGDFAIMYGDYEELIEGEDMPPEDKKPIKPVELIEEVIEPAMVDNGKNPVENVQIRPPDQPTRITIPNRVVGNAEDSIQNEDIDELKVKGLDHINDRDKEIVNNVDDVINDNDGLNNANPVVDESNRIHEQGINQEIVDFELSLMLPPHEPEPVGGNIINRMVGFDEEDEEKVEDEDMGGGEILPQERRIDLRGGDVDILDLRDVNNNNEVDVIEDIRDNIPVGGDVNVNNQVAEEAGWVSWDTAFKTVGNPHFLKLLRRFLPGEYVNFGQQLMRAASGKNPDPLGLMITGAEAVEKLYTLKNNDLTLKQWKRKTPVEKLLLKILGKAINIGDELKKGSQGNVFTAKPAVPSTTTKSITWNNDYGEWKTSLWGSQTKEPLLPGEVPLNFEEPEIHFVYKNRLTGKQHGVNVKPLDANLVKYLSNPDRNFYIEDNTHPGRTAEDNMYNKFDTILKGEDVFMY